jgi:type II secretory pathway pseudopilin PulG
MTLSARKATSGQMLIGILVAIAVFAILIHAVFTLIASSYELVSFNRARITARHLAQERIELIRNLSYSDIGTVGGIPNGILEPEEQIVRNGLSLSINTSIVYIDDPFNGTSPSDTDYKRVRVEVSWGGVASSRKNPVVLITDISPQQTSSETTGTLLVIVFDANGQPIPQATVIIQAPSLTPPVDLTQLTNSEGEVTLPGAVPCNECYEISISKDGYSSDRTYSTSEVANPLKPHATIIEGSEFPTQVSFSIDRLGSLSIESRAGRDTGFTSLGNVSFRIRGNKLIGTDAYAQPVYKFDNTYSTNTSGAYNITNAEWDVYHITMPASSPYDISGASPPLPINLDPAGDVSSTFATEARSDNSFFLTVKDPSQNLIASASARLYDDSDFDTSQYTGDEGNPDFGQTLFSNLEEKTYHLQATASGYLDFNGDFDISGYTQGEIILSP